MKKLRLVTDTNLTLEERRKSRDNCRARNLRKGTIEHYKQRYIQFYKCFDKNMKVCTILSAFFQLLTKSLKK